MQKEFAIYKVFLGTKSPKLTFMENQPVSLIQHLCALKVHPSDLAHFSPHWALCGHSPGQLDGWPLSCWKRRSHGVKSNDRTQRLLTGLTQLFSLWNRARKFASSYLPQSKRCWHAPLRVIIIVQWMGIFLIKTCLLLRVKQTSKFRRTADIYPICCFSNLAYPWAQ